MPADAVESVLIAFSIMEFASVTGSTAMQCDEVSTLSSGTRFMNLSMRRSCMGSGRRNALVKIMEAQMMPLRCFTRALYNDPIHQ